MILLRLLQSSHFWPEFVEPPIKALAALILAGTEGRSPTFSIGESDTREDGIGGAGGKSGMGGARQLGDGGEHRLCHLAGWRRFII